MDGATTHLPTMGSGHPTMVTDGAPNVTPPTTGRNGCRSYIRVGSTWVFNSMVRFGPTQRTIDTTWRPTSGREHFIKAVKKSWSQAEVDKCPGPVMWRGEYHIAAHNYCNNWASDAWHSYRKGDRVTVALPGGKTISGLVTGDFSLPYSVAKYPGDDYPYAGGDLLWLQTSWRDSIRYNTNHFIVVALDRH